MKLSNDVARCLGLSRHPLCIQCARQRQIQRDKDSIDVMWLSYIQMFPENGECQDFIQEAPMRESPQRREIKDLTDTAIPASE